jgi:uncharacterized protein YraI
MKSLRLVAAAGLGVLALAATPAFAAAVSGFVTANVNERSGPSTSYPPITVIPAGSAITIYGCLSDDSWCDISWNQNRGWMSSNYLQVNYQSRRIPIRGYSGIPFITFNFGNYWNSHYRSRPFFNQRSKWSNFQWQKPGMNNPPKPSGSNGQFGNGKFGSNGQFGSNGDNGKGGKNGQFSNNNGQSGNNSQYNNRNNKDCWKDGKWICGPRNP